MMTGNSTVRVSDHQQSATAQPSAGGAHLYFAEETFNGAPVDGQVQLSANLDVPISVRSTFNVQIAWHSSDLNAFLYGHEWEVDDPTRSAVLAVASPQPGQVPDAFMTTALTREAGTWTVAASSLWYWDVDPPGFFAGTIRITVIVGANTEDDCVIYQSVCS